MCGNRCHLENNTLTTASCATCYQRLSLCQLLTPVTCRWAAASRFRAALASGASLRMSRDAPASSVASLLPLPPPLSADKPPFVMPPASALLLLPLLSFAAPPTSLPVLPPLLEFAGGCGGAT